MSRRPGDFTAVWAALTSDARQQIDAEIAGIVQAEHVAVCRRLRELARAHAGGSERQRLLAFLDVVARVDLLDAAGEA